MTVQVFVPRETTACALGADAVAEAVAAVLAQQNMDARVIRNGSRGAFFLEPLLEIEKSGQRLAFGPVGVDDVAGLFNDGRWPDAAHPLCLGLPAAIPWIASQTRLTFARLGEADPLDFEAYQDMGGLAALHTALKMDIDDILQEIEDSGLRGRGGAAFPAGTKWRTVAGQEAQQKYVVCNADEGDSGTFADRLLMECDPYQLLEAMVIAGFTVGADKGYIYIRSEYPKAYAVLLEAIEIARSRGLLGHNILGSGKNFEIEIRLAAGAYICGEETALLESLEGKRGLVRKKPPVPALSGLFNQPTLVHNVLTLAAVTTVIGGGAGQYASLGAARSRGTMPFQLSGNVARGGLVEVPFGMPLQQLLNQYAGGTRSGKPLKVVQVGGPLGAYLDSQAWSLPLEYEAFTEADAILGHGGIVLFDDSVDMAAQAEFAMEFCAAESCGKCTPCRVGAVRGAELIRHMRLHGPDQAHLELLGELLETMELGSLCALGGMTPMPVRSILTRHPQAFGANSERKEGQADEQ